MKRSYLNRRTPLRRNKRLRRRSKKRQQLCDEVYPAQDEFLCLFPRCAYPGCRKMANCIHECVWGSGMRKIAFADRRTWLPSCAPHNSSGRGFHDLNHCPFERQWAIKRQLDPEYFDLDRLNELLSLMRGGERIFAERLNQWSD